ncbi:MAG: DUF4968 domain-containing protein [Bacteroidetes bacterium]|jgi:alpha-D-xyloside xylohydrolase|nr:DUF4968 domain-containing protein [Bacteroidota bacterium]
MKPIIYLSIIFFLNVLTGCNSGSFHYSSSDEGITAELPDKKLHLKLYAPNIVRVTSMPPKQDTTNKNSLVVIADPKVTGYNLNENEKYLVLTTDSLILSINKQTGAVQFADRDNQVLLAESKSYYEPDTLLVNDINHIEQHFRVSHDEALYGMGQHQNGFMNLRGKELELYQNNQTAISPVLLSTKGYGIIWDNYSYTKYANDSLNVRLWSEVGDCIDYYFIAGDNADQVISGYRDLTGKAPLYGKWAYGFFQSKEHYHTQDELLSVVNEYRERNVPLDVIVQDWYYWEPQPWGSHYFDRERYPDPSGMIEKVHEQHAKIMISVWAKFEKGSPNFNEMMEYGCLSEILQAPDYNKDMAYYDPYSPECRDIYWKQIRDSLFKKGIDAWWLDATEPEMGHLKELNTKRVMENSLGSGARYLNTYALMNSKGIYNAQRAETDQKRVYILTRSAFAGQQRYAASTWSGDITANWDVFQKQIPAGLNFTYTGIPYWTTDIGAFFVPIKGGCNNPAYKELFVRWYQYGAFCPLFRVHGTHTPREIWQFGEPGSWAYDTQLKFNNLRHRLLPYIYSTAWQVTKNNYTMMRGLAFDFPDDVNVYNIDDQFMFGNSFLVNPVTQPMYHKWLVHGKGVTIPSENLIDNQGRSGGLTAEYFSGKAFSKKILIRKDTLIDFHWGNSSPENAVPDDNYSIRWSGQVKTDEAGEYMFVLSTDDGSRLWLDNKLIIDNWVVGKPGGNYATINLEANHTYSIRFEYHEATGEAHAHLGWITPGDTTQNATPLSPKYRDVYLPEGTGWYDFWTGKYYKGNQTVEADAPIDIMPLFVKEGSIVPMGPYIQYWNHKLNAPVNLRVYTGSDAKFVLYADEEDNYNYENGMFSEIPIYWNEQEETLTIGDRIGEYPGMRQQQVFNIIWVSEKNGTGVTPQKNPDQVLTYIGNQLIVKK